MADEFPNIVKILSEYGDRFRQNAQQLLLDDDKVSSGELVNTITYSIKTSNVLIHVNVSLQDYYKWVAEGRSPGKFPPVQNIIQWIRSKPIIPTENGLGKIPTENQLAYLIGRKIARDGIEGNDFFNKASDETWNEFQSKLDEALTQDLEDINLAEWRTVTSNGYSKII